MEFIALQLGCLLILLYISILYLDDTQKYNIKSKLFYFDHILVLGIVNVLLDAAKTYAMHNFEPAIAPIYTILYGLYFTSIDAVVFVLCVVIMFLTDTWPSKRLHKIIISTPFVINIIVAVAGVNTLEFIQGSHHYYAVGIPSYTCYAMAAVYMTIAIIVLVLRWKYIERHKRIGIITYIIDLVCVALLRAFVPDLFIAGVGCTLFVLGVYLNLENPAFKKVEEYHTETVVGFSNLIENRDFNTGGHIKRTSIYVKLIANELLVSGNYKTIITKDYIKNLVNAAPMHDIGKVSVPDSILQKPGPLTGEEYEIIKRHADAGGRIIKETFKNLGSKEFREIAYNVARYHHEKWNGNGYPDGLKGKDIPLCARIMAVADVFDALSEKRCYRDAMPLDKCFEIILSGRGTDFDPDIVDAFLKIRPQIENVHQQIDSGDYATV